MSKMSRLNLQLQEQAEGMGFSTVQEALDNGYHVVEDLVAGTATLQDLNDELAHEAWLNEKEELLSELYQLRDMLGLQLIDGGIPYVATVYKAIKFIEGVSHE